MNQWATWELEKRLDAVAKALEANEFRATVVRSKEEAAALIEGEATGARTVGFGGSVTLAELGFPGRLAEKGYECLAHGGPGLSLEERAEIMRRQLTCDLFLTGINAVTLDGKLVNIDANGNRVGALTFGPRKVIAVVGANKIADDVEAALRRVRAWASPANAYRLGRKTPCAATGLCSDCRSPERICRIVHIMERRPPLNDLRVILVGEPLGL